LVRQTEIETAWIRQIVPDKSSAECRFFLAFSSFIGAMTEKFSFFSGLQNRQPAATCPLNIRTSGSYRQHFSNL
jgi:hypothetical protein